MTPTVVLAADAHPGAGLGHIARSSALACALSALGVAVTTVALGAQDAVELDGLRWQPGGLPLGLPAAATVLDSYSMDDGLRGELAQATRLVQFEDARREVAGVMAIGPLSADFDDEHRVAGPSFVCLRRGLWGRRAAAPVGEVSRVLVTTGGSDPTGEAARFAEVVRAGLPSTAAVTWIRPAAVHAAPAGVTVAGPAPSLTAEMLASDLVVCGGGLTMVEAAALGVPCVALVLAENQRPGRDRLAAAGAVRAVDGVDEIGLAVQSLACSVEARRALARTASDVVDGFGAFRVAARVAALAAAD